MIDSSAVEGSDLQSIAAAALTTLRNVQRDVEDGAERWEIGEAFDGLFHAIMDVEGWEQKISTDLKSCIADALVNYGAMQWCTLYSCRLMAEQAFKEEGPGGSAEELLNNIRQLHGLR